MKANISSTVTIEAHASKVFEYLSNLKYHQFWNPQIQKIKPIQELKLHVEYQTTSLFLGKKIKTSNIVTKFKMNEEIQIENTTGLIDFCANYKVKASGKDAVVHSSITVSSKSKAFAFTAPVLKALAQRELNTDLEALKVAVEQNIS